MEKLNSVQLAGLHESFRRALPAMEKVYKEFGLELVITCALDGLHSAGSVHYYGKAVDIRSRDPEGTQLTTETKNRIAEKLRVALGCCFDVVVEKDHIHVEVNY